MFLGHVFSQIDLLHSDEIGGNSCYTITLSLHCAILQVFVWDRSHVTLAKCRNLKYVKAKFQGSLDVIKGLCGSFTDGHFIIFHWSNMKGGSVNLIELFD